MSATVFLYDGTVVNELGQWRYFGMGVCYGEIEVVIKETGDRTFAGPSADRKIIVTLTDALTGGLRIQ